MSQTNEIDKSVGELQGGSDVSAALMDVHEVAVLLKCSVRHIYRLSDAERMPRPIKLGALVRWNRAAIEAWLAKGCPDCRKGGRN